MPDTLSLTQKRWTLRSGNALELDPAHIVEHFKQLRSLEDATELTDPFVFSDMQKIIERIGRAIEANERIGIFGDYDCDGVTAVAQLKRALERRGCAPYVRLPHRVRDGYGLNSKIVEELIAQQIDVLITADTGIASIAEIAALQSAGIDVIITDHHQPQPELPPAYAYAHPALIPNYPEPHPSGAGVAFQCVRALEGDDWEEKACDEALAMMGTIADLVPLQGDNRLIVQQGLRALRQTKHKPLLQLLDKADIDPLLVTSTDIAFRVAPRINAAGRMADPDLALQALLEGDSAIDALDEWNQKRQQATRDMTQEALDAFADADTVPLLLSRKSTEYSHGIIGLIAGKLTEHYGRPTMIATIEDDLCTASLRSPPCYHITEGMRRCEHLIERYGGHAQAAGCTVQLEHWDALCRALEQDIAEHVHLDQLEPTLTVDAQLDPTNLSLNMPRSLKALEPYGQGNPEPLFVAQNVQLSHPRQVGADGSHLQCTVGDCKAIGFGLGHLIEQTKEPLDIVYRVGIDVWQGRERVQVFVVDARKCSS